MRSRSIVILLSVLIALLTLVPYLSAYAVAGDSRFTGFLFNPCDAASYLAKMRQGYDGRWFYSLAFTDSPGPAALLFPYYLFLGHLARILHLSLVAAWQIARLAGVAVFLPVAWEFFGRIGLSPRARAIAWAIAAIGSGFGFAAILGGAFTADLWVAEYIPFLGMLTSAHFPIATALVLILVMRIALPAREPTAGSLLLTGAAGLLLGAIQPFGIIPAGLAMAIWIVWKRIADGRFPKGSAAGLIAAGLGVLPWAVYDFWIVRSLPRFASWFSQNLTTTPPVWDLALSLGLPGLIAALLFVRWILNPAELRLKIRSIPGATLLLGLWVAVNLGLLYAPFSLQRRLMLGMWIPLAALAAPAIESWLFRPAASLRRVFILGLPLVLTNGIFFAILLTAARQRDPAFFLSRDEAAAADWLSANARGSVVLASPELSLWLPGMAGVRVVYGHPMETPDAEKTLAAVEDFLSGRNSTQVLTDHKVDFIVYGPREQAYGGDLDLAGFGEPIIFGTVRMYPAS